MPAAITDKFQKVGVAGTLTSLAAPGKAIGAASINIGSASNWPTDTAVTFAIRQVDSAGELVAGTYTSWKGIVSGNTIGTLTLKYGTDQIYPAGATTQVYIPVSASRENEFVDGMLVEHLQSGAHGATTHTSVTTDTIQEKTAANGVTIDSLNVKDGKLNTANSVVEANYTDGSIKPEHLVTGAGTGWAWQSWTLSWSNLTVGNGTLNYAKYVRIGNTIHFRIKFTLGSTSVIAGNPTFTLPVNAHGDYTASKVDIFLSSVALRDTSASDTWSGLFTWDTASTCTIRHWSSSPRSTAIDALSPFTWATGDFFQGHGEYEVA